MTTIRQSKAYSEDGGKTWKWQSNHQYCPVAACLEDGIPCDVEAQEEARDAQVSAFLAAYREVMKNHTPSAEERHEMRAAFGAGKKVVNVVTGQTYVS